jgi:hypothetical protein
LIQTDIPELDLEAGSIDITPESKGSSAPKEEPGAPKTAAGDSEGCSVSATRSASLGWIAFGIVAMWLTRRRTAR